MIRFAIGLLCCRELAVKLPAAKKQETTQTACACILQAAMHHPLLQQELPEKWRQYCTVFAAVLSDPLGILACFITTHSLALSCSIYKGRCLVTRRLRLAHALGQAYGASWG